MDGTFKQKLAAIVGESKVDEICQLIATEIIGKYELAPLPGLASWGNIERWQEQDNDIAVKNALRREQRRKLGFQK